MSEDTPEETLELHTYVPSGITVLPEGTEGFSDVPVEKVKTPSFLKSILSEYKKKTEGTVLSMPPQYYKAGQEVPEPPLDLAPPAEPWTSVDAINDSTHEDKGKIIFDPETSVLTVVMPDGLRPNALNNVPGLITQINNILASREEDDSSPVYLSAATYISYDVISQEVRTCKFYNPAQDTADAMGLESSEFWDFDRNASSGSCTNSEVIKLAGGREFTHCVQENDQWNCPFMEIEDPKVIASYNAISLDSEMPVYEYEIRRVRTALGSPRYDAYVVHTAGENGAEEFKLVSYSAIDDPTALQSTISSLENHAQESSAKMVPRDIETEPDPTPEVNYFDSIIGS